MADFGLGLEGHTHVENLIEEIKGVLVVFWLGAAHEVFDQVQICGNACCLLNFCLGEWMISVGRSGQMGKGLVNERC